MKPFIRFHGFAVIFLIATLSGKKHFSYFVFILDKVFDVDIK